IHLLRDHCLQHMHVCISTPDPTCSSINSRDEGEDTCVYRSYSGMCFVQPTHVSSTPTKSTPTKLLLNIDYEREDNISITNRSSGSRAAESVLQHSHNKTAHNQQSYRICCVMNDAAVYLCWLIRP
ncbi:unnamed protein product, partial [Ectocarpus sp. 4 AP-2014]